MKPPGKLGIAIYFLAKQPKRTPMEGSYCPRARKARTEEGSSGPCVQFNWPRGVPNYESGGSSQKLSKGGRGQVWGAPVLIRGSHYLVAYCTVRTWNHSETDAIQEPDRQQHTPKITNKPPPKTGNPAKTNQNQTTTNPKTTTK